MTLIAGLLQRADSVPVYRDRSGAVRFQTVDADVERLYMRHEGME